MSGRPPRTISREDERRDEGERYQRWFESHGIMPAELSMLRLVIQDVNGYTPYDSNSDGKLVRKWRRQGAEGANEYARRAVLSRLLDRIDGEHIADWKVMEKRPDFAPGLTRDARQSRLFSAIVAVDELEDSTDV